jgi:hypothetical protein
MKSLILTFLFLVSLSASAFAADKVEPVLELLSSSWSHESDSNFAIVIGQVKNISKKSLDHVEAIANFTDAKGNFISSQTALIKYNPILPDQVSPFKVMVPWNPELKNLKTEFKQTMRGKLEHREKKK